MAKLELDAEFFECDFEDDQDQVAPEPEFDDYEMDDLFISVCKVFDDMKKYLQDQNLQILNKQNTISNLYLLVKNN